jgi:hypothetical protein
MRLSSETNYQNKEIPKCKRVLRNYDDFSLCVNIGQRGYVLAEHPNERNNLFYYGLYGSGKFGKIFESDCIILDAKNKELVNVSEYIYDKVVFEALSDFYIIGFNTFDKNVKWDGRLITNDESPFVVDEPNSYFICLNGNIRINDKEFKRFDYALVDVGKEYQIKIAENSALGLFTKLN